MVIIMAWQMAGYVMVIYIAGLQNVPPELNEAAKIDWSKCMAKNKTYHFPNDKTIIYNKFILNTFELI